MPGELAGDTPLLEADVRTADDLVGDDDGQHDDSLDDEHEPVTDPSGDLQAVALGVEVGEQQRGEGDADGVVATEQGDGDAGKPRPVWTVSP